jgi:hypothetical protein
MQALQQQPAPPAKLEAMKAEGLKSAADLAKQIITLSGGAIGFTVTFVDKYVRTVAGKPEVAKPLYAAWALFALTIAFAIWNLMGITGSLDAFDRAANSWPLTPSQQAVAAGETSNVRLPAAFMILAFLAAMVAMIWAGLRLSH